MDDATPAGAPARTFETLTYALNGYVGLITLNRPISLNAMSAAMKEDLRTVFFDVARGDESRCLVLTGAGDRAFCAGADIKERAGTALAGSDYYVRQQATLSLFSGLAEFDKPIIGAINGVALGGGMELALCCDIRIAASHARFGLPEVKLGSIPGAGGTQRLVRAVGESRAKELIFTGDFLSADQALAAGLVSKVVPGASLMSEALALATRIAAQAPLAIRFAKRAVDLGVQMGLPAGLQFERFAAAMLIDSEDRHEGMRAFVEKRAPNFKGK